MAIGDFFTGLGQRVGRGLMEVGGYDPMQQVSPEEAAKRRSEGLAALQRSLGRSAAILSGDPRRVQFAEQQMQMVEQEKKQEELNKKLNDAIDKSNLPQSQKDLLKSLNVQTKAQTLMQTFEPIKITTDRIRAALLKKINDFGYDSLTTNEKETLAQIQNLDPFERRTRGLSRFPGTGAGTENDVQNGYIDTGETTQDGKKIFKDKDGNKFVETGS